MKTCVIFLLACITGSLAFAQNSWTDDFFSKYEGKPGFTSVLVTQQLFSLLASATTPDNNDIKSLVEGLQGVKVLAFDADSTDTAKAAAYYREAYSEMPKDQYDALMTVHSETDNVLLLGRMQSPEILSELLLLCTSDDSFVLVQVKGTIDLNNIAKLKDLNIEGLDKIPETKNNGDESK